MTSDLPSSNSASRRGSLDVLTTFVAIIAVCAVGSVLTVLRSVITPLLTGLLLLFLINPGVSFLDERRVPRWLTYLLLFVVGAAGVIGMEQLIETQVHEVKDKLPEYSKRSSAVLDKYAQTFGFADKEGRFDWNRFGLRDALPANTDQIFGQVLRMSTEILELCTMALFYLLFGLSETHRFSKRMTQSLSSKSASGLSSVLASIQNNIWKYLWTKTVISIGMGATTAALGWLFSLDFWLLWGFLMFLANYVTYIGSIVAILPPILVSFVQFESVSAAVGFSVLLLVVRLIWIDYAEMRFSGKQVNVSPLLVLLAVALLGWMWGPVGMLLAVPLLTVARVVLGSFPQTRFVASLISDLEE